MKKLKPKNGKRRLKKVKTSSEINELAASLVMFQADMPTLPKDAKGYGYKYTSLDKVVEAIRGTLAQVGLSFVQMPSTPPVEFGISVALTTRLMHVSGQWLESTLVIPVPSVGKANEAQTYGAALTYARRYALTSMLGIVADEDVDAAPAQSPPLPKQRQAKTKAKAKATPPVTTPNTTRAADDIMTDLLAAANNNTTPATEGQLKYARASLSKLVDGSAPDAKTILNYVFAVQSSADLTSGEASAIIEWAGSNKDNGYTPNPESIKEAARIITAANIEAGQVPLFDDEPTGNNYDD